MTFRPLPLLGNPHVQTVLGNLLSGTTPPSHARTHRVSLADGDQVVVHESEPGMDAAPRLALLVHGLGGSAQSGYMERMTHRLTECGWRVFRMDLRGAGAGMQLAQKFYSAACSHDVRAVIDHLGVAFPGAPIAVVGFSLGGNIVLKLAGEAAEQSLPALRAVAALAPPIDLVRCSELMAKQPLYDAWYVRQLIAQVRQHQRRFPELPRLVFPSRTTLWQFDDLYTAPRWGYADALDYYRQASAVWRMAAIRVPTFVLTARDDPFVAVESFETLHLPSAVEIHITAQGGHLGFLGRDDTGGIRWAETQIVNWLNSVAMRTISYQPSAISFQPENGDFDTGSRCSG